MAAWEQQTWEKFEHTATPENKAFVVEAIREWRTLLDEVLTFKNPKALAGRFAFLTQELSYWISFCTPFHTDYSLGKLVGGLGEMTIATNPKWHAEHPVLCSGAIMFGHHPVMKVTSPEHGVLVGGNFYKSDSLELHRKAACSSARHTEKFLMVVSQMLQDKEYDYAFHSMSDWSAKKSRRGFGL